MTVCLYEYTRSSDTLRAKLEAWHAQPIDLHSLAEMDYDAETGPLREMLERIPNRTNAQLIELVFDKEVRNSRPEAACLLLHYLLSFLPLELWSETDPAIALRFSDFARSWEQMRCDLGEDYLRVRLLPPPVGNAALFEITGPLHLYAGILEDPAVRHETLFIDWSYSLDQLTDAFREWADQNRPELPEIARQKLGRRSAEEPLRWLAAYRMKQAGYSFEGAKEELARRMHQTRGRKSGTVELPTYGDKSSWSKAVRKAKRLLDGDLDKAIRAHYRQFRWTPSQ